MNCPLVGVSIQILARFTDERGWLMELFRRDELSEQILPSMCYLSVTKAGVTRGPHEHKEQCDLFAFVGPGQFRVYLWDNRPDSTTFGQNWRGEFGEAVPARIIVPCGVVHAYRNIGAEDGLVFNAPNRLYRGWGRQDQVDEIRHEEALNPRFKFED